MNDAPYTVGYALTPKGEWCLVPTEEAANLWFTVAVDPEWFTISVNVYSPESPFKFNVTLSGLTWSDVDNGRLSTRVVDYLFKFQTFPCESYAALRLVLADGLIGTLKGARVDLCGP